MKTPEKRVDYGGNGVGARAPEDAGERYVFSLVLGVTG